jgi:hypothetical protein
VKRIGVVSTLRLTDIFFFSIKSPPYQLPPPPPPPPPPEKPPPDEPLDDGVLAIAEESVEENVFMLEDNVAKWNEGPEYHETDSGICPRSFMCFANFSVTPKVIAYGSK